MLKISFTKITLINITTIGARLLISYARTQLNLNSSSMAVVIPHPQHSKPINNLKIHVGKMKPVSILSIPIEIKIIGSMLNLINLSINNLTAFYFSNFAKANFDINVIKNKLYHTNATRQARTLSQESDSGTVP
jgi:hypothetical protein